VIVRLPDKVNVSPKIMEALYVAESIIRFLSSWLLVVKVLFLMSGNNVVPSHWRCA